MTKDCINKRLDKIIILNEDNANTLIDADIDGLYSIDKFVSMTIDINSIPYLIRKRQYVDYLQIFNFVNLTSRCEILDESFKVIDEEFVGDVNQTYSVEDAINTLKTIYKISEYQYRIYDPYNETIVSIKNIPDFISFPTSILIPYINRNLEIIDKEMKRAGYYKVAFKHYIDNNGQKWINAIYDPIIQKSVTEQLRDKKKYIYHCSPIINKDNIKANGFIPKNEGRVYKYCQPRLYFHCSDPASNEFKKMMTNISNNRKRNNSAYNGDYLIYEIKVKDIPKNIDFFNDPHGLNSIFCTEPLPYCCVNDVEETHF